VKIDARACICWSTYTSILSMHGCAYCVFFARSKCHLPKRGATYVGSMPMRSFARRVILAGVLISFFTFFSRLRRCLRICRARKALAFSSPLRSAVTSNPRFSISSRSLGVMARKRRGAILRKIDTYATYLWSGGGGIIEQRRRGEGCIVDIDRDGWQGYKMAR